ncbi:MAG: M12 family metallo-peptidase [Pseudomonadales bacterium]
MRHRVQHILIGLMVLFAPSLLALPGSLHLNGHDYQLVLEQNTRLHSKLRGDSGGRHYTGHLPEVANSWVRISHIDGSWSGLASIAGDTYTLSGDALRSQAQFNTESAPSTNIHSVLANAVTDMPHKQCATKEPHAAHSVFDDTAPVTAHSVFAEPVKLRADFSQLCASLVDGVCLLAEVEFVFDQQFQSELSDPQATATAIVNMVEGYYEEAFDIVFDVITMEFLTSEVFTTSTDADVLLGGTDAMHPIEDPLSIRALSSSNQLSFEQSRAALLHLVTGRDFDGGTAGIAFTDVLCNGNGFASGTSQLLGSGSNSAAITALIAAHEIGHNFGANHDGVDNSCANGFLMEPSLSQSTEGFSSCSFDEVESSIDAIDSLAQCFNFPVDTSIAAAAGNPVSADMDSQFTSSFSLSTEVASQSIPQLLVQGSISAGEGNFVSATLNGAACMVSGATYSCSLSNPGATADLQVTAVGSAASVSFAHTVSFAGSTDLSETDQSNNTVTQAVSFAAAVVPTPEPEPTPDPNPTPEPTEPAPSEPTPSQNQQQQAASSDGGGGGGSIGFTHVLMLLLLAMRRNVFAVCSIALLSACAASTDHLALKESRLSSLPAQYSVVQQKYCYCTPEAIRPVKIWVSNGKIDRALYEDDGSSVPQQVSQYLKSIEQWQHDIDTWKTHDPHRLELAYYNDTELLMEIDFDPSKMKSDDEFRVEFRDYAKL